MKSVWNLIDGRKTQLGVVLLFLAGGAKTVGWVNEETFQLLVVFIGAFTVYGVRDAVRKVLERKK